ncbi:reverse transcriptase domain-containing protein [Tanacetum coccineum]
MPFGLTNARANYQRLVDKVFASQIGRNMEAYIDDTVINIMDEEDMLLDIKETFEWLQEINMKLNLKKCSFGMEEGQFLGHMVSKQGIKANPTKVQALTNLKRLKTIKEVQSLNGKLATLNIFLAKSEEKDVPFFKTLKGCLKKKDFIWTKEVDKAFKEMKKYIEKLPTLLEKSVKMARWVIEFRKHEIENNPKNVIKAQVLKDFLAETQEGEEETKQQSIEVKMKNARWRLYTDGASSKDGSKAD